MRKYLVLICCLFFIASKSDAQYVNIPDSNFRNYLKSQYPSCFDTLGRMDTTCGVVLNEDSLFLDNLSLESIDGIQYFKQLRYLTTRYNLLNGVVPQLPNTLWEINFSNNPFITGFQKLPDSLIFFSCNYSNFSVLPDLPKSIQEIYLYYNKLNTLPVLPDKLKFLFCTNGLISSIPNIPSTLKDFYAENNKLTFLPKLPDSLEWLEVSYNNLTQLPKLPLSLVAVRCTNNQLTELPELKNLSNLTYISCQNNNIHCLPLLPESGNLNYIRVDSNKIKCISKELVYPTNIRDSNDIVLDIPVCNPTNNINHCQSFPIIQSFVYTDQNSNNKFDISEYSRHNIKFTLSNNNYSYTNTQGTSYINADSLGTYTITPNIPNFYNVVPASYTHNFTTYDTLVIDTFALQPNVIKDSIAIKLTPTNWAARPGCSYPYWMQYENVGTTILSTPTIHFNYDSSLLIYDSSSVNGVANNGNNLSLNIGNIVPGQAGYFAAYFTVKTTASLGSTVTSVASINTNSVNATDTATTIVRSSYDPNDKQATPNLSVAQVADNNHWIDYTIRFQNTGTDTAFNVVIADTLSSLVQWDQLQFTGSSHLCRTTVKGNVVFFEFIDIYLPDSNTNKTGSNGFVSFGVKPLTTLTNGTLVPNTASNYFDYNSPIVTNTAHTLIGSTLPLALTSFNAIPKEKENKVLVYWNTANEINTSFFLIEQSTDGRTFKPIVEIAAKGSGNNSYFYSIAKNNIVYLRLKMVDKNGTYTYSNIIKLAEDKSTGFDIVNNPAKNTLNIRVYSSLLTHTTATIVTAQGKIVKTFILNQNLQTIDIAALQAGNYFLQTILGTKKFVVE